MKKAATGGGEQGGGGGNDGRGRDGNGQKRSGGLSSGDSTDDYSGSDEEDAPEGNTASDATTTRQGDARGNRMKGDQRQDKRYTDLERAVIFYLRGCYAPKRLPSGAVRRITRHLNKFLREAGYTGKGGKRLKRNFHGWRQQYDKMRLENKRARVRGRAPPHRRPIEMPTVWPPPPAPAEDNPADNQSRPSNQQRRSRRRRPAPSSDPPHPPSSTTPPYQSPPTAANMPVPILENGVIRTAGQPPQLLSDMNPPLHNPLGLELGPAVLPVMGQTPWVPTQRPPAPTTPPVQARRPRATTRSTQPSFTPTQDPEHDGESDSATQSSHVDMDAKD
ncbi:hypothetical protein B0A50_00203 [Salinomyces thailandicus]|uniref:Uncharacterized protein n=1 Tax=Salinomyces thailandicus TaxID=706561 RepID=A0A4U0UFB2_9PEZI|nr:hypothetical protein B0A50_00203 [Salinomyces thailandica]